jgi:hypothetical protein
VDYDKTSWDEFGPLLLVSASDVVEDPHSEAKVASADAQGGKFVVASHEEHGESVYVAAAAAAFEQVD